MCLEAVPMAMGVEGHVCNFTCPISCPTDQMKCPGGSDENGCIKPDICMPIKTGK